METILQRRIVVIARQIDTPYPVVESFHDELKTLYTHFVEIEDSSITSVPEMVVPDDLCVVVGVEGLLGVTMGPLSRHGTAPRRLRWMENSLAETSDDGLAMFNRAMRALLDQGEHEVIAERCFAVLGECWREDPCESHLTAEILAECLFELGRRRTRSLSALVSAGHDATQRCQYEQAIKIFDQVKEMIENETDLDVYRWGQYWLYRSMTEWRLSRPEDALRSILRIIDGAMWAPMSEFKVLALNNLRWYVVEVNATEDVGHEVVADEEITHHNIDYVVTRRYPITGTGLAVHRHSEDLHYLRFVSNDGRMGVPYMFNPRRPSGLPLEKISHVV